MSSSKPIVVIDGNLRARSRTAAAGVAVAEHLAERVTPRAPVELVEPLALGGALFGWGDPAVEAARAKVLAAQGVVVATPTYKASYTGLLKAFLDHFDGGALAGAPVALVMTGGSERHALAVDVHLAPLMAELGAVLPVPNLYLWGSDVDDPLPAIERWLRSVGDRWPTGG